MAGAVAEQEQIIESQKLTIENFLRNAEPGWVVEVGDYDSGIATTRYLSARYQQYVLMTDLPHLMEKVKSEANISDWESVDGVVYTPYINIETIGNHLTAYLARNGSGKPTYVDLMNNSKTFHKIEEGKNYLIAHDILLNNDELAGYVQEIRAKGGNPVAIVALTDRRRIQGSVEGVPTVSLIDLSEDTIFYKPNSSFPILDMQVMTHLRIL